MGLGCDDGDTSTESLDVNSVCHLEHMRHVVTDEDDWHASTAKVADQLQHQARLLHAEGSRGLVKDHDLAAERCSPGGGHGLALPA